MRQHHDIDLRQGVGGARVSRVVLEKQAHILGEQTVIVGAGERLVDGAGRAHAQPHTLAMRCLILSTRQVTEDQADRLHRKQRRQLVSDLKRRDDYYYY